MKRPSIKLGIILLVTVLGAVFLNKYILKDRLVFYPKSFVNLGSYLFKKAENMGGLVEKITNFNHLANENDKLKENQGEILSLRAKIDNLETENSFLRRSVRISQKLDRQIIYAGIFNLNLSPAGYNVLLNKGAQDGISEGDIVITDEGILVGQIQKVMQNFSRVLFVSDSGFKINAKVLGSDTVGIARGALNDGMYLDFVVQADEIKEKDVLITTGNDIFPPALIIGSVDYVSVNETQMFKNVRIRPAVKDTQLGKVLVVKIK
jgi:rod shape-determining protein MreC